MKKDLKLSKWMLCASTGALMYTASLVYSDDAGAGRQSEQQQSQQSQSYQSESQSSLEIQSEHKAQGTEISEPSGAERPASSEAFSGEKHAQAARDQSASFGTLEKASDIIGMEVQSQQGEKLGDVKDVMIDLQSGRVPFAVLSSGGVLGVGDRLLAIPPTALRAEAGQDAFVLGMSQDQLRNAPTFERNQWPETMDQQWSANVYRFYGQQPYWRTAGASRTEYRSYEQRSIQEPSGAEFRTEMHEPAGATYYEREHVTRYGKTLVGDNNTLDDINKGSGTRGGAEDLTDFDEKANASKDAISEYYGAHHGEYRSYGTAYGPGYRTTVVEPSAAGRGTTTTIREQERYSTKQQYRDQQHMKQPMRSHMGGAKLHRGSDLIGLNVKNAQGETIGEIKDVVIDVNSGRVAFVAFEGSGALERDDQWLAIPASMFSGLEGRQVTLNVSPDRLRNAPSIEEGSWEQAMSEDFVSRVYSHYGQQPYWRSTGRSFQEPSGTPRDQSLQQEQQDEFKQEKTETEVQSQDIEEPSGAQKPESEKLNEPSGIEQKEQESPEREISEPSGAELQSQSSTEAQPSTQSSESSAQVEQQAQPSAPSAGVEAQVDESGASASAQAGQAEAQAGAQISEEAGAQPEQKAQAEVTEPSGAATSAQQTGAANLVEHVRTELQRDTASGAQNIQVATEQGKIVLKGTVNSEADKQRIEEKVQDLVIDNQLEVKGDSSAPSQP